MMNRRLLLGGGIAASILGATVDKAAAQQRMLDDAAVIYQLGNPNWWVPIGAIKHNLANFYFNDKHMELEDYLVELAETNPFFSPYKQFIVSPIHIDYDGETDTCYSKTMRIRMFKEPVPRATKSRAQLHSDLLLETDWSFVKPCRGGQCSLLRNGREVVIYF